MRTNIDTATTTINFEGVNVSELLAINPQLCNAVWGVCIGLINAKVNVSISERQDGAADWHMTITSPSGRRSFDVQQASVVSPVRVTRK